MRGAYSPSGELDSRLGLGWVVAVSPDPRDPEGYKSSDPNPVKELSLCR